MGGVWGVISGTDQRVRKVEKLFLQSLSSCHPETSKSTELASLRQCQSSNLPSFSSGGRNTCNTEMSAHVTLRSFHLTQLSHISPTTFPQTTQIPRNMTCMLLPSGPHRACRQRRYIWYFSAVYPIRPRPRLRTHAARLPGHPQDSEAFLGNLTPHGDYCVFMTAVLRTTYRAVVS